MHVSLTATSKRVQNTSICSRLQRVHLRDNHSELGLHAGLYHVGRRQTLSQPLDIITDVQPQEHFHGQQWGYMNPCRYSGKQMLEHCKNHLLFLLPFSLLLLKTFSSISKKCHLVLGLNLPLQELEPCHVESQYILQRQTSTTLWDTSQAG